MFWLKPLTTRGQSSEGENLDTQVAWLRVEGPPPTKAQIAEARKTFGVHVDTCSLSLAGYHVIDYKLPDGSRMRVTSNSGIHQAILWTAGGGEDVKLPHGFLVVTNWAEPRIFKRRLTTPPSWAVDPIAVPQAKQPIESDNQVFRATGPASYFNHPLVLTDTTPRSLWDYTKKAVQPALSSSSPVVPVCVQVGSRYDTADVHYCIDNVVYGRDGTTLYTMALAPAILVSDPETPRIAPANTTANGSRLVLQHYRSAIISPTFGVYRVRCASEVLQRTAPSGSYAASRTTAEFDGPLGGGGPSAGDEIADFTERPMDLEVKVGDHITNGTNMFGSYVDRFTLTIVDFGSEFTSDAFQVQDSFDSPPTLNIAGTLAVPMESAVDYPLLSVELNISGTQLWRGGWVRRSTSGGLPIGRWFGRFGSEIERRDSQLFWATAPSIKYQFAWADLKLLEGESESSCEGGFHVDTQYRGRNNTFWRTTSALGFYPDKRYIVPGEAPPFFGEALSPTWDEDMEAANIKSSVLADVEQNPEGAVYGGSNKLSDNTKNERAVNSAQYSYVSRYVIDFDSKGQFWAAIRVEVESTGAVWTDDMPGGVEVDRGDMRIDSLPTTVVRIFFESNWRGSVASQLLAQASTSLRPPFEYVTIQKKNPYTYATAAYASSPTMLVRVAPLPSLPSEATSQLRTLMQHQGVNTRLACADVRLDIAGEVGENVQSKTGIEFSTFDGKAITVHRKYVTGQLYARTFKIADFPDALWLLRALKCDATENNGPSGPAWFYMPALNTTINTQEFHIEVRDGVIERWSDEFRPSVDQPAPLERDIKLYRV